MTLYVVTKTAKNSFFFKINPKLYIQKNKSNKHPRILQGLKSCKLKIQFIHGT